MKINSGSTYLTYLLDIILYYIRLEMPCKLQQIMYLKKNRNSFSHTSGGYESKIKVWTSTCSL